MFEGPWGGVIPPTPSCSSCGARPKANHGPVIPMEPPIYPTQDLKWMNGNPYSVRYPNDPVAGCDEMGPFIR